MLNLLEAIRMNELKENFKTAYDLKVNYCLKCGFCCNKRTCIPIYKEFIEICNFLNLSIKKTIRKYFCIDKFNYSDILFIKPAGINQLDLLGEFIPITRTFDEGKCIFLLENNLCKIYEVRPKSAKISKCWENNIDNKDYIKIIKKSWSNDKLKEIYKMSEIN